MITKSNDLLVAIANVIYAYVYNLLYVEEVKNVGGDDAGHVIATYSYKLSKCFKDNGGIYIVRQSELKKHLLIMESDGTVVMTINFKEIEDNNIFEADLLERLLNETAR